MTPSFLFLNPSPNLVKKETDSEAARGAEKERAGGRHQKLEAADVGDDFPNKKK